MSDYRGVQFTEVSLYRRGKNEECLITNPIICYYVYVQPEKIGGKKI